jgi:hypothetical protein
MDATETPQNGKGLFSLPTFGCEGCANRKEMLTAGNWQVDLAILAIILAGAVVFYKVKIT